MCAAYRYPGPSAAGAEVAGCCCWAAGRWVLRTDGERRHCLAPVAAAVPDPQRVGVAGQTLASQGRGWRLCSLEPRDAGDHQLCEQEQCRWAMPGEGWVHQLLLPCHVVGRHRCVAVGLAVVSCALRGRGLQGWDTVAAAAASAGGPAGSDAVMAVGRRWPLGPDTAAVVGWEDLPVPWHEVGPSQTAQGLQGWAQQQATRVQSGQ